MPKCGNPFAMFDYHRVDKDIQTAGLNKFYPLWGLRMITIDNESNLCHTTHIYIYIYLDINIYIYTFTIDHKLANIAVIILNNQSNPRVQTRILY